SPAEVAAVLAAFGVPQILTLPVADENGAVAAAAQAGFPVALKAVGPIHKSEAGGVALGMANADAVASAWRTMAERLGSSMTGAIVQPMARPGVETIAGVVHDQLFGPLLLFGLGGTAAELLRDQAVRLVPLTSAE